MPRLVKYTTSGIVDDVPDMALAIIEHTAIFYLIDKRFSGRNKYIAYAAAGAGYEVIVASIKAQDADKVRKSD
jgi:hypothetical protein